MKDAAGPLLQRQDQHSRTVCIQYTCPYYRSSFAGKAEGQGQKPTEDLARTIVQYSIQELAAARDQGMS